MGISREGVVDRDADRFDRAVDALGHKYRRRLLEALLVHNPQDDDDAQDAEQALERVADGDADEELVMTQLIHNHLPKLEAMDYIAWDKETGEIAKGENWAEIEPLLKLLRDHEDELPDGWL